MAHAGCSWLAHGHSEWLFCKCCLKPNLVEHVLVVEWLFCMRFCCQHTAKGGQTEGLLAPLWWQAITAAFALS
jgi:hypothetical protein